jgi:hypothetical protein
VLGPWPFPRPAFCSRGVTPYDAAMPEYLPVDALTRPGFTEDFYSGVLAEVVAALIGRGVLQGKTVRGKQMVLADEAFERLVQLGIEPLVYGQQGWAFAAVLAPIDDVLEVAREIFDVVESRQADRVYPMRAADPTGADPPADVRPLYLVKPRASDWTVLIIRVHWFKTADAELAESFARDASRRLKTRAVAAFDDDVSGSYAQEWAGGKPGVEWSSNDDGFYLGFYEREIACPSGWPGVMDGRHAFFSLTPQAIERVDYVGITEPPRKEHPGMKKITVTPESQMTAGDLLAQFAQAMGAPVGKAKKPAKSKPSSPRKKKQGKPVKRAAKAAKKRKGK